jgi:hypothetical protein
MPQEIGLPFLLFYSYCLLKRIDYGNPINSDPGFPYINFTDTLLQAYNILIMKFHFIINNIPVGISEFFAKNLNIDLSDLQQFSLRLQRYDGQTNVTQ